MKLNIYIRKFEDFAPLNEVYDKFFGTPKPVSERISQLMLSFGRDTSSVLHEIVVHLVWRL